METGETFAYLDFPIIPPEKMVGDYLKSKLEMLALRKYPEWDIPRPDPIMRLVGAKRDLHQAELKLTEKKREAKEFRKSLDEQWDGLHKDAEKFKQTFCKFDEMIKENAQKRKRAVKKTEKLLLLQIQRDKDIEDLKLQFENLTKIKDKMEYQIKEHKIYENYLQSVADTYADYKTPMDIYNKFGAIFETRADLTMQLKENINLLENIKDNMSELNMAQNSTLTGFRNCLTGLHNRYTTAKFNAQKWEEMVKKIQVTSSERLLELLKVKEFCWNLYLQMCERKQIKPEFDQKDFENQLEFIKKTMTTMTRTLEIAQEIDPREISSVQAQSPRSKKP